jgi:hypothetical protein
MQSKGAENTIIDLRGITGGGEPAPPAGPPTSPGDMLAILQNAERSLSSDVTLTDNSFGAMHVCTGSTDFTVTLPPAASHARKFIGVRIVDSATALVTLASSDEINGETSRLMWAGEAAILLCDGTTWQKVAGVTRPMTCELQRTPGATVSVPANTDTKIAFQQIIEDNTGEMEDIPNGRMAVIRSGTYLIESTLTTTATAAFTQQVQNRIHKNGSLLFSESTVDIVARLTAVKPLVVGDYVEQFARISTGSSMTVFGGHVRLLEVGAW